MKWKVSVTTIQSQAAIPIDDNEPDEERQKEIEQQYLANQDAHPARAPYAHVKIRTRGELFWIMCQRNWTGEIDIGMKDRPDLRLIDLSGTLLGDIALNGANLHEARLSNANLQGANLFSVDLSHADLRHAILSEAVLPGADLSHADLEEARFEDTQLIEVNLTGAYLDRTNLSGADLWGAQFDATTKLRDVILSDTTRLGDVVWNNVPLKDRRGNSHPLLGDRDKSAVPSGSPSYHLRSVVLG